MPSIWRRLCSYQGCINNFNPSYQVVFLSRLKETIIIVLVVFWEKSTKKKKMERPRTCAIVITVILIARHFSDATRFIKHSAPARRRGRWCPALNCEYEAFSGLFHHYIDIHCNDHPFQDQTSLTQEMILKAWLSSTRMVFILLLLQKSEAATCRPGDCTSDFQNHNHFCPNHSDISLSLGL